MKELYKVRFLPAAEDDLTEMIDYIAQDRPSAAVRLLERFQKSFDVLKENALIGKIVREEELSFSGYRYLIIGNYLVFYVIEESLVEIHRIIHSARDYLRIIS
jgi:toxin ParE1/3/4